MRLPCKKLSPRYVGPFTITRQINLVTYLLQLPPQYRIHPSFHVSLLKPYHSPSRRTPSSFDSGGRHHLKGQRDLGLPAPWWSARIPSGLFKKNSPSSSKNNSPCSLQHIQLSDTTGTSNGTGFYGQMKLKN